MFELKINSLLLLVPTAISSVSLVIGAQWAVSALPVSMESATALLVSVIFKQCLWFTLWQYKDAGFCVLREDWRLAPHMPSVLAGTCALRSRSGALQELLPSSITGVKRSSFLLVSEGTQSWCVNSLTCSFSGLMVIQRMSLQNSVFKNLTVLSSDEPWILQPDISQTCEFSVTPRPGRRMPRNRTHRSPRAEEGLICPTPPSNPHWPGPVMGCGDLCSQAQVWGPQLAPFGLPSLFSCLDWGDVALLVEVSHHIWNVSNNLCPHIQQ